ncbi:LytR/AlgR family response regulator transcription factor [Fusibacter bizertensis]
MIDIFICEDDSIQLEQFAQIINNHILIENLDMQLKAKCQKPEEILEHIKDTRTSNIYFLDVDLSSQMNGIELAEQIRFSDPRGFIIFVTTHEEMTPLTFKYKVEALDYIIKGNSKELNQQILQCLLNIDSKTSVASPQLMKRFNLRTKDKTVNIEFEEIFFFETAYLAHKVAMHCKTQIVEFNGSLNDIEEQLDDRFVRCHRSYVVNIQHISEIDHNKKVLILHNGQTCLLSSRGLKTLKTRMEIIFPHSLDQSEISYK